MFALSGGSGKGTSHTEHPIWVCRQAVSAGHSVLLAVKCSSQHDGKKIRGPAGTRLSLRQVWGLSSSLHLFPVHLLLSVWFQSAWSSWCASHCPERSGISVLHFHTAHFNLEMLLLCTTKPLPEEDNKLTKTKIHKSLKKKKITFLNTKILMKCGWILLRWSTDTQGFLHTLDSVTCSTLHL